MFFRTCAYLKNLKALQAVPGASDASNSHSLYSKQSGHDGRISRCAPVWARASLTAEAALVFPLFLFAVTGLLYLFLLVQLQTEVGRALTDAGKELAQSEEILNLDMESTAAGISMAYTKHCLDTCLEGRAAGRMIKGGARGISLLGCRLEGQDSFLVLNASYQVVLPPGLSWFCPISISQSRRVRCWTGFGGRLGTGTGEEEEVVYVTDYGTVYHRSLECRHLKLSIRQVCLEEAKGQACGSGGNYKPCERCWKQGSRFVYIAEQGDRYHESLNCPGLSRRIHVVLFSQAGGRPPCSVCGGT